jgi:hypothetical protein
LEIAHNKQISITINIDNFIFYNNPTRYKLL